MSKEQQNQVSQEITDEKKEDAVTSMSSDQQEVAETEQQTAGSDQANATTGKKRVKRKTKLVNAEDVMPRPSIWPVALAFALVVLLVGIMTHPVIFVLGVILVIGAIIGWALERR